MKIGKVWRKLGIDDSDVALRRTAGGVVEVRAKDDLGIARGLGFAHAHDRLVQMVTLRILGQGRLSECLASNPETNDIDLFMREMGLAREAAREVDACSEAARSFGQAYCDGVNASMDRHRRPLEFLLVGHRPEPWRLQDILLTIKVMSYVGLAQMQQDMEKLLAQAIGAGVSLERLRALFSPHLDGVDDETVDALARAKLYRPTIPSIATFTTGLPRFTASNNWAVAPSRSATGTALQCNDPHLECNRLPAIWYEFTGYLQNDYRAGITVPGMPGVIMGRTKHVSMGFTYGFMDTVDYFVEEVKQGQVRRGSEYRDLERRKETVLRKKKSPVEITLWESDLGVLEADPRIPDLEDGFYLSRAWTGHRGGAAGSLDAVCTVLKTRTAREAAAVLREVTISCNWLLADRQGEILYQQSGRLPARRHSGLYPVPAWREELHWDGMVPADQLACRIDHNDDILVTANEDLNEPGKPLSINLPMGPYRSERIRSLLLEKEKLTLDDMKRIQQDLYSRQAECFMQILKPLLPDTNAGRILTAWDLHYDSESEGAPLFEAVYAALLREVFGKLLFGHAAWDAVTDTTNLMTAYYYHFDRILLEGDRSWFGAEGREGLFRRVTKEALDAEELKGLTTWGAQRQVTMVNIFFGGQLPSWLGFDHGPITFPGGRATVVQAGIFRSHGRLSSFFPSYRYVTDVGEDRVHTVLAGGPSGRRFSKLYLADIERWLSGGYKELDLR